MASKRRYGGAPKYQKIFEALKADIIAGAITQGRNCRAKQHWSIHQECLALPWDARFANFKTFAWWNGSLDVARYVRDLRAEQRPHLFGLLIPDLGETEIL
jgi:hypothetical protein